MSQKNTRDDVLKLIYSGAKSLRGMNLAGADLSDLDLRNLDFTGCNLQRARFTGSDMRGCRFDRANLRGAVLRNVKGEKATFNDSDVGGATLCGSDFTAASMKRANLEGAAIDSGTTVLGASFDGAWRPESDRIRQQITNRPGLKPSWAVPGNVPEPAIAAQRVTGAAANY